MGDNKANGGRTGVAGGEPKPEEVKAKGPEMEGMKSPTRGPGSEA